MKAHVIFTGCASAMLVAVALTGCGTSANSATSNAQQNNAPAPTSTTKATGAVTMTIVNFQYSPTTAAPGQTVNVVNKDGVPHTVTATGIHVLLDANGTGSFVAPSTPGNYQIMCDFHPQMRGNLTVS